MFRKSWKTAKNCLAEREKEWISKEESFANDLRGKGDSEVAYQNKVVALTDEITNLKIRIIESDDLLITKEKELTALASEKHNLERVLEKSQQDGVKSITQIESEKTSLINQIQELNEEIVKKGSKTEELQIVVKQIQLDLENKDKIIVELEGKLKLSDEKNNEDGAVALKRYEELESHMKMVELANFELAAKVTKLSEDLQQADVEKVDIESNLELFQLEADKANKELIEKCEILSKECDILRSTGADVSKTTQDLIEKNSAYAKQCDELKDQISKKDASIADLSSKIEALVAEVASLKDECIKTAQLLNEKNSTFDKECAQLKDQISIKDSSITELISKMEALNLEINSLKGENSDNLKETNQKLDEIQNEKLNISKEVSELRISLKKKEEEVKALEEDNEVMKQVMQNEDEVQGQLEKYQNIAEEHRKCGELITRLQLSAQNSEGGVKKAEKELLETKLKLQSLENVQKNNNEYLKSEEVNDVAQIQFLNSIIADMQKKNDTLKAQVEELVNPLDFTK